MADKPHAPGSFPVPHSSSDIKSPAIYETHRPESALNSSGTGDPHTSDTPLLPKTRPFRFLTTWQFWAILVLGQILSWCIVSTNTLTQYLVLNGANIPAFQTVFNYALLAAVYTPYTFYKYGLRKWIRMVIKDGWKYFVLAFVDVQGVYCPLGKNPDVELLCRQGIRLYEFIECTVT